MSILDKLFRLFTRTRAGSGSSQSVLPAVRQSRVLPEISDALPGHISHLGKENREIFESISHVHNASLAYSNVVLHTRKPSKVIKPQRRPVCSAWEREGGINETVKLTADIISFSAAHMNVGHLEAFKAQVHSVCSSEVIAALPTNGDLVYRGGTLDTQLCHSFRKISSHTKEAKREGAAFSNITKTSFFQKFFGQKIKPLVDDYLPNEKFGFFRLVFDSSDYQKIMDSLTCQINSHVYHGGPKLIGTSTSKTFELALLFSLCRAQIKVGLAKDLPGVMGQVGITIGMDPSYYPYRLDVNYADMVNTGGIDEDGMTKWVSLESSAYENEIVMLSHHIFQHRFAVITQMTPTEDDKLEIRFKTLIFDEINIEYAFPKDDREVAKKSADLMKRIGKDALQESQAWSAFQAALLANAQQQTLFEHYTDYILMLMKTHDIEKQLIEQSYNTALRLVASGKKITLPLAPQLYGDYKQTHWSLLNKYEPHYNLSEAEKDSLIILRRCDDCVRLGLSLEDGEQVSFDYSVYEIRTMMMAFLAMNLERTYGENLRLSIRQNRDIDFILCDTDARNRLATYLIDKLSKDNKISHVKFPVEVENVTNEREPKNAPNIH